MKEAINNFLDLTKGLMQPAITVFTILVGAYLIFGDKIAAENAWWLVLGVFGFWFGKTVGLFGNGKAPELAADANKDLIAVVAAQQNTINNAALDLGASVPVEVVKGNAAPVVSTTPPATVTDNDNPDVFLTNLAAELDKEAQ
jgi:hypothetical protein